MFLWGLIFFCEYILKGRFGKYIKAKTRIVFILSIFNFTKVQHLKAVGKKTLIGVERVVLHANYQHQR